MIMKEKLILVWKEKLLEQFQYFEFLMDTLAKMSQIFFLHILLFQKILIFFFCFEKKNWLFRGGTGLGRPP